MISRKFRAKSSQKWFFKKTFLQYLLSRPVQILLFSLQKI